MCAVRVLAQPRVPIQQVGCVCSKSLSPALCAPSAELRGPREAAQHLWQANCLALQFCLPISLLPLPCMPVTCAACPLLSQHER